MESADEPRSAFIKACFWHGSIERANAILASYPEIAGSDIHTAAMLGDDAAVARFLALDPAAASANAGFYDMSHTPQPEWEPVFSRSSDLKPRSTIVEFILCWRDPA